MGCTPSTLRPKCNSVTEDNVPSNQVQISCGNQKIIVSPPPEDGVENLSKCEDVETIPDTNKETKDEAETPHQIENLISETESHCVTNSSSPLKSSGLKQVFNSTYEFWQKDDKNAQHVKCITSHKKVDSLPIKKKIWSIDNLQETKNYELQQMKNMLNYRMANAEINQSGYEMDNVLRRIGTNAELENDANDRSSHNSDQSDYEIEDDDNDYVMKKSQSLHSLQNINDYEKNINPKKENITIHVKMQIANFKSPGGDTAKKRTNFENNFRDNSVIKDSLNIYDDSGDNVRWDQIPNDYPEIARKSRLK